MIEFVLVLALLTCAAAAVFLKDLLSSIVAMGLSSVFLALIFFRLGAFYAGGFELSVGSVLMSLLFIMTISLTEKKDKE